MKKITAIVLALMMVLLVGCGDSGSQTNTAKPTEVITEKPTEKLTKKPTEKPTEKSTEKPTEKPTEKITEKPTEKPVKNQGVDIDWNTLTFFEEDNDGYTYEVSMKLSPWILLSNSETVNAAWSKVSSGKSLPGFSDWGLKNSQNMHYRNDFGDTHGFSFGHKMSDMYYCVGELTIKNATEGWNITDDNQRSVNISMNLDCDYNAHNGSGSAYIWRIFFSSGAEDYARYGICVASLKKNTWGPVPIIIMAPENFSPNYPNGEYYEDIKETKLKVNGEEIALGIIGKDES